MGFFKTSRALNIILLLLPMLLNCALSLTSCTSGASVREKGPSVYLADNSKYFLLPASGIGQPMDMAQFISASYNGKNYYFNAWIKADETGLDISLFNELGASLAELSYRDGAVDFSSSVFPKSLRPEYIVADFQLCFYDSVLLGRALDNCGITLQTGGTKRRLLKGKKLIVEIEKSAGLVKLENHLRGYSYTLEGDFE